MILILHFVNYWVVKWYVLDALGDQYVSFLRFGKNAVKEAMETAVFLAYVFEAVVIVLIAGLSFLGLFKFYKSTLACK